MGAIPSTSLVTKESVDFKKVKFKDIIILEESSNMVSLNNKRLTTRLHSILGIPTIDISNPDIKVIAKSLDIKGCRLSKKLKFALKLSSGCQWNSMKLLKQVAPKQASKKAPASSTVGVISMLFLQT